MKTFTITIPEPCHEDWSKMTPDAKGAFCGSCQKSVYDFSTKTDAEIIDVFEKKGKEKVCGRFAPAQLSRPVVSFGNASATSRLAKFAYALLLVFGAALFNGAEAFGQTVKGEARVKTMGKVAIRPTQPPNKYVKDTPTGCEADQSVRGNSFVTPVFGQSIICTTPIQKTIGDTVIVNQPIPVDTTITLEAVEVIDTTIILEPVEIIEPYGSLNMENHIMGLMVSRIIIEEELPTTVIDTVETKTVIISEPIALPVAIEIKATPNPSNGEIKLSYNLETATTIKIDLFDVSGKWIKTLTAEGKLYPGNYTVSYNIADLPNGIYIAALISNNQKTTTRIVLGK